MFENIDEKIKMLAVVTCWIGIVTSAIWGLVALFSNFFVGLITIVVGVLISWVSSFSLYGYGEMLTQLQISTDHTYEIYKMLKAQESTGKENTSQEKTSQTDSKNSPRPVLRKTSGDWVCANCGTKNDSSAQFCKDCGEYK